MNIRNKLSHPEVEERYRAVWKLYENRVLDAIPDLIEVVEHDESDEVRGLAVWVLMEIDEFAVSLPQMLTILATQSSRYRYDAALAIYHWGTLAKQGLRVIVAAIAASKVSVRRWCVETSLRIGTEDPQVFDDSTLRTSDDPGTEKALAAFRLAKSGSDSFSRLETILSGRDRAAKVGAALACGVIGVASERLLRTLLRNEDDIVRYIYLIISRKLNQTNNDIVLLLNDSSEDIRLEAAWTFGRDKIAPSAHAVPSLINRLSDTLTEVRFEAVNALYFHSNYAEAREAILPLLAILIREPPHIIKCIGHVLLEIGVPNAADFDLVLEKLRELQEMVSSKTAISNTEVALEITNSLASYISTLYSIK